jgi:hypothetical protein
MYGKLVAGDPEGGINTKTNRSYIETAHMFYAYHTSVFGTSHMLDNLQPFEINKTLLNRVDIDTMDDLQLARAIHAFQLS